MLFGEDCQKNRSIRNKNCGSSVRTKNCVWIHDCESVQLWTEISKTTDADQVSWNAHDARYFYGRYVESIEIQGTTSQVFARIKTPEDMTILYPLSQNIGKKALSYRRLYVRAYFMQPY